MSKPTEILLSIPRLTPSNNVLLRMHYMARHLLNAIWLWEVTAAALEIKEAIPMPIKKERRVVKIISYRPRRYDPENNSGGLKPLLDALKKRNLIYDDHEKYIDLQAEQVVDKDNQRTEVIISW